MQITATHHRERTMVTPAVAAERLAGDAPEGNDAERELLVFAGSQQGSQNRERQARTRRATVPIVRSTSGRSSTEQKSGRGVISRAASSLRSLRARIPRFQCPEHGVRQAGVPWTEPRSRFTLLFERFAMDVMLETDIAGAANIARHQLG